MKVNTKTPKAKKKNEKPVETGLFGISKWIKEYRDRFSIDLNQLEQTCHENLAENDVKSNEQSQNNNNGLSDINDDDNDDGGWTVVSHSLKRTRQRMVPSTDKTLNRLRAKQKYKSEKKELVNFYKFQMTDKKIDQLDQLKMKFELDKQRIAQMRQQRKFKPF